MIDIRRGSSYKDGGCVACSRYNGPTGTAPHKVWIIRLQSDDQNAGVVIRLCYDCLMELLSGINNRL